MLRMTEIEFAEFTASHPNAVPAKRKTSEKKNFISEESTDGAFSDEEKKKKAPKYLNHKVYVYQNGIGKKGETSLGELVEIYDSVAEYNRGVELLILQKAGIVSNLERQVRMLVQEGFTYHNEKIRPIYYVADFRYINKDGCTVIEDVKAFDKKKKKFRTTADFDLKWKLLKHRYPDIVFHLHANQY